MMDLSYYEKLADLFDYPTIGFPERVKAARVSLCEKDAEARKELDAFIKLLPADDLHAMEELHTRTFDVQAITTLDLGYVLFGDDYKRGELLSNFNREHERAGNDCRGELADHLANILRLIPKLDDQELIGELVREIIVPAMEKMINEFNPERIRKKDESLKKHYKTLIESSVERKTLYRHALKAVYRVIRKDFSINSKAKLTQMENDFLKSIESEMKIEDIVGQ